jgi:hypothetical protein
VIFEGIVNGKDGGGKLKAAAISSAVPPSGDPSGSMAAQAQPERQLDDGFKGKSDKDQHQDQRQLEEGKFSPGGHAP